MRYNVNKEMIELEKTATLNLRVNPESKRKAEAVLKQLGIPMSTAMDIYLNQIALVGGIPFPVTLPRAPAVVNADLMDAGQLAQKLREGVHEAAAGMTQNASEAFRIHREKR